MRSPDPAAVVSLDGVSVRRGRRTILGPLDWTVRAGERWVVVGPNGSGKTTLAQVASTYLWPSAGTVEILGQRIGRVDARELRRRVGYAGSGLEAAIDPALSAGDVVLTARHAALGPWWHTYDVADRERARLLLERLGVGSLAGQPFGQLSSGERRRVQIARALMPRPELLILDEPAAGLDLGARELLVRDLSDLAADRDVAAMILITHHVEEVPAAFGHALLLAAGLALASGPIAGALTSATLSAAFGLPIELDGRDGRLAARLADPIGRTVTSA